MQRTNIRRMAYRATTTRSILDWCAMLGVLVGCYFWASLFIDLYQPSNLVRWGMILAISFLFSLVLPALLSLLVPTTPASQLLQKTRWGTVGFWFTVAVALFILYVAWQLTWSWQAAQPQVTDTGIVYHMTLVWMALLVFVPGLAFVQMPTEKMAKEFQQAQAVRRLELSYKHDLLLAKEAYGRALAILRTGLDRATLEQRQYMAGVFQAIHTAEAHNLRVIAGMIHDYSDTESVINPENDDLAQQFTLVADAIIETADQTSYDMAQSIKQARDDLRTMSSSGPQPSQGSSHGTRDDATLIVHPSHALHPSQTASERPMGRPGDAETGRWDGSPRVPMGPVSWDDETMQRDHEAYHKARQFLTGAWMSKDLQTALRISKSQASRYIQRWHDAGLLDILNDPKYHYTWTTSKGDPR